VGRHYRERLGIDEAHLPGESVVRGLAAALFSDRRGPVAGRSRLW